MLRIINVEEIEDLLLLLTDLVHQQERGFSDFITNVDDWLSSLERVFEANRLYQAGNIAMLRSTIIAVKQGQVPGGIEIRGRKSRSRILKAVASDAMQRASEVASYVIEENRPRIEEAIRVAQQIIASALSRGLMIQRVTGLDNTEYLKMVRRSFDQAPDLENAAVHLEGLVGPQDALVLLDRALTPHFDISLQMRPPVTVPSISNVDVDSTFSDKESEEY